MAYGAAVGLTALQKRRSQELRGRLRFCVAWKATFPKKIGEPSSPVGIFPASFVEMVWSTFPKWGLFGNVEHYRQLHEFALLRLMPVQLPH